MSSLYNESLAYCVDHSIKHDDYSLLGALVDIFETRDYKLFVSSWVCERLGLKSKMGARGAVFARSGNPTNERMSWKVSLEEFAAKRLAKSQVVICEHMSLTHAPQILEVARDRVRQGLKPDFLSGTYQI